MIKSAARPRLFLILALSLCLRAPLHAEKESLTQYSTIEALLAAVFKGSMTLHDLSEEGDFGIGTYNGLDGEMILLDGVFYQITGDGTVLKPGDETLTPFACVCDFDEDDATSISGIAEGADYTALLSQIDSALPSMNLFYAVKVEGTFSELKARSVHAQKEPYPPLAEIVKNQSIFEFHDVEGTLVGFRCPTYAGGVNVPGYHLHFLRKDKQAGGHVLGLKVGAVKVSYIPLTEWEVILPESGAFLTTPLGQDVSQQLQAVETAK